MKQTRINKYLAESGYCSRRQADELIKAGKVLINGEPAKLGDKVTEDDLIKVIGGKKNASRRKVYFALHKPVGVITTMEKEARNKITDYIKTSERIFPVGRLDVATSGLILLTNDGELAHKLTHASFGHEKEYVVDVDRDIDQEFVTEMSKGVELEDFVTKPAKVKQTKSKQFKIILKEGRNRQIRRMCEALGYNVVKLKRIRFSNVKLANLPVGESRELSKKEIEGLRGK